MEAINPLHHKQAQHQVVIFIADKLIQKKKKVCTLLINCRL